jgi:hypothetical protein
MCMYVCIYIYTEWTYHGFTIAAESGAADAAFRDFGNQRTSTAGVTRKPAVSLDTFFHS